MRKIIAPLLVLTLASCAWRRDVGFARQRLTGTSAASDCFRDGAAAVCHWTPKGIDEDPDSVLFFLHYATGDERSAARVGVLQSFYRRYKKAGRRPPRVFTISYGGHWLLSSAKGQRQVVDRAEFEALLRRLEKSPPQRRYLWGLSMGGYNAAEEALASPQDWTAAALDCPALQTLNPFDAPTRGLTPTQRDGFVLFNYRLGSARVWDDENPLVLARRPAPTPAFLIETNAGDEFGFQPGARALADALKSSGRAATFRVLPGTHCAVDGSAAAEFFLALPQ
jgi:pimeloyl-ACP methyl ester carboxylesterase